MNAGVTYVEINYDANWVNNALASLSGFSWLYEWGMYIFLIATLAILFWIFFDSITKKEDQKALVPRILAIVGFFAVIPAFIFRFTGNADGVTTLVKLNAETGTPYYPGPIYWNVNLLVNGYGTAIAIIALVGVVISIAGLVIYMSSVQRAKIPTEFARNVNSIGSQVANLEDKVNEASRNAAAANAAASKASALSNAATSTKSGKSTAATIIDRKPQAATIIDVPQTGATLIVQTGAARGTTYNLPAKNMAIGRDPKGDIVVDDGKVSGTHAMLIYSGGAWAVLDQGSTNGTYLNGQRIIGQQSLSNGDQIRVGDTTLVFGISA